MGLSIVVVLCFLIENYPSISSSTLVMGGHILACSFLINPLANLMNLLYHPLSCFQRLPFSYSRPAKKSMYFPDV